jgi:hypothetical protein
MSQKIGYQDGIAGFVGFLKKFPLVVYRPPEKRPLPLEKWSWLEKLERTLRILKDDHDALVPSPAPVPPPPDPTPVPPKRFAPRTHNLGVNNQDPRFCTRPEYGVVRRPDGLFVDEQGCLYDQRGENVGGNWRVRNRMVQGIKDASSMDGLEPCETYQIDGQSRPPYPADSYLQ